MAAERYDRLRQVHWTFRWNRGGPELPLGLAPGLCAAERVGFEPTEDLRPHFLSREAPSAVLGHLSGKHAIVGAVGARSATVIGLRAERLVDREHHVAGLDGDAAVIAGRRPELVWCILG